ncbi:hypothetical protein [Phormidium sp. CCY1219]|uniref:hypothetical protein n=1 Tax=Phormidium sp. CCY1219 TaxID=2886104 RepID=UPI002D1ED22E|nr:hypothetical protein [Phormidium sp. CCY1219]MEB3829282.1 hypothetical protein [Phormidium sp. CCY1219]
MGATPASPNPGQQKFAGEAGKVPIAQSAIIIFWQNWQGCNGCGWFAIAPMRNTPLGDRLCSNRILYFADRRINQIRS